MNTVFKSLLAAAFFSAGMTAHAAPDKPNILFRFTDGMSLDAVRALREVDLDRPQTRGFFHRGLRLDAKAKHVRAQRARSLHRQ
jgi:hypothetical protein